MTNLSSLAITDAELTVMAQSLAYDGACSAIESCCAKVADDYSWFDATPGRIYEPAREFIAEAIKYLEARGLLERHDDNPNWVSLNDESEATR